MIISGRKWVEVGRRSNRRFTLIKQVEHMFFGQYDHNIDEKGRFTIPARYRVPLENGAYITLGFDDNLMVLRADQFEKLSHNIQEKNITHPKTRELARFLFGNADLLEIDKNGRILIPQFLRNAAKMDSAVKVVGLGIYFEIWSLEIWNKKQERLVDGEVRADLFADMDFTF